MENGHTVLFMCLERLVTEKHPDIKRVAPRIFHIQRDVGGEKKQEIRLEFREDLTHVLHGRSFELFRAWLVWKDHDEVQVSAIDVNELFMKLRQWLVIMIKKFDEEDVRSEIMHEKAREAHAREIERIRSAEEQAAAESRPVVALLVLLPVLLILMVRCSSQLNRIEQSALREDRGPCILRNNKTGINELVPSVMVQEAIDSGSHSITDDGLVYRSRGRDLLVTQDEASSLRAVDPDSHPLCDP